MTEKGLSSVYLSLEELLQFSLMPAEKSHLNNVNFNNHDDVESALRSAGIQDQQRKIIMQSMYNAGYIQGWPMVAEKIKRDF